MKKKEAIERIIWRFSEHPVIRVNEKDREAVNTIIDCINSHDGEAFKNNYLLAKLYMKFWQSNITHYNTDSFDTKATRAIHELLEKPITWHISEMTTFLNHTELLKHVEEKGKLEKADNTFDENDVEMMITQLVNECLRNYGDV